MEQEITSGAYDAIIHSAAVSDYRVASIRAEGQDLPAGESALKISSSHPRLFLELVPTAKIVDRIRAPWGFAGKLVKFKLQVGLSDAELIKVAERSRRTSSADIIVANCFEWMREYAYIIGVDGEPQRVSRERLAAELLNQIL
jgi:phosphopantothenate-cysteine ligase/phosphopantothenoylcysteine decarboxylase/phosphopantothenate--cysteine ligase